MTENLVVSALEAALEYMDECECHYPDGSPDFRSRPGYHPCAHDKVRAALPIAREMAERERAARERERELVAAAGALAGIVRAFLPAYLAINDVDPRSELAAQLGAALDRARAAGAEVTGHE